MEQSEIRSRIRAMGDTGELPCNEPLETWAGNGDGTRCAACLDRIPPRDVEFEVQLPISGRTIRLHRACYRIWLEECKTTSTA